MAPETFDGYIRVSRVGGREGASFISPKVQRETIERLEQAHGLQLGEVIEESDVSGSKPVDERKLGRLIRKIEAGESAGLIVWKLSRFSRNLLDGVTVADRITRANGRLLAEDFDSDQAMGKAILGFLLGWAEEELDARRAGWREAQRRAAERGVFPSRTPVGYLRIQEEGENKGRFVPDPDTASVITELFRMRASGASLGACATRLQEAVPGRGWSPAALKQLFASPAYRGRIVHGDNVYVEDAHEALVDEHTWQLAQREGIRTPRTGSIAGKGVLLGLIRCEGCGHPLTVVASGPRGARYASYTCRKRRTSGVCPAPATAQIDKVDALVLPDLEARADSVDLEAALIELYDAQIAFAKADRELEEFLAASLITELGPELYGREAVRRREAVREAGAVYSQALDAQDAMASANANGMAEQRELARRLIESVTLRKSTRGRWERIEDRVTIQWR
jgi:site-specific DNA recombinase